MTSLPVRIPRPATLWRPLAFWIWFFVVIVLLDAVPHLLVQYWFNQSLGYHDIFWTNLRMQATLFAVAMAMFVSATVLPVWVFNPRGLPKRILMHAGLWAGVVAGWVTAGTYQQFLLALHAVPFGQSDPVYHNDIGLYVYTLPALRTTLATLEAALALGIVMGCVARWAALEHSRRAAWRLSPRLTVGAFAAPYISVLLLLLGSVGTIQIFLQRYALLLKDNAATGVRTGPAYVDVVGIISNLNRIHVLAFAVAAGTILVFVTLVRLHRDYRAVAEEPGRLRSNWSLTPAWRAVAALVALPVVFSLAEAV